MGWTELDAILALYEGGPGPFCLATLARVNGSSYRQPGARLLTDAVGSTAGSLSAGCVEEEVTLRGTDVLRTGRNERLTFDLRPLFGCDGNILVVLEPVTKPHPFFERLTRCRCDRQPFLATVRGLDDPAAILRTAVVTEPLSVDVAGVFSETLFPPIRLVLVGDRPDTQPLARLATFLHWDVLVLERPDLLPAGDPYTGCVVMSHRLGVDLAALRAALGKGFGYVALVGGKTRRERLFHELVEGGIDPGLLGQVHGPAGLDIGAESPEEIALAIVSEVQAVLAGRDAGFLKHRRRSVHDASQTPRAWAGLTSSF